MGALEDLTPHSTGAHSPCSTFMNDWQASIFHGCGGGEVRLWFLHLTVPGTYPSTPPVIKFVSKISMECVDARGNIIVAKVPYLASWNSSKTMLGALQVCQCLTSTPLRGSIGSTCRLLGPSPQDIKALMNKAPRAQPADGTNY